MPRTGIRERAAALWARPRVAFLASTVIHVALVAAIVFWAGADTIHGRAALSTSPDRIAELYFPSDAGSYLYGALDLVRNGAVTAEWQWVLNLWPPGMVWLNATIIEFSPLPYGVTMGILTALLWGVTLAVVTRPFLARPRIALIALVVELLVLATPPFQTWMLDEAILFSDGIAGAALLLGLALITTRALDGGAVPLWVRDGILSGIAIAVAVYFRASNNLIPIVIGAVAVVLAVVVVVTRLRRGVWRRDLLRHTALLGIAVLSAVVLFAPYAALTLKRHDRLQFVATQDLVYEHAWQDPERDEIGLTYLVAGFTVGCDLDAERCRELAEQDPPPTGDELRDALIATILENPGPWAAQRVEVVVRQWFRHDFDTVTRLDSQADDGRGEGPLSLNENVPAGLAYLAMLLATCVVAVRLARRDGWSLLVLPLSALALLAPFAIVHVEVRYLIPLKLLALLAPMLLLRARRREAVGSEADGSEAGGVPADGEPRTSG